MKRYFKLFDGPDKKYGATEIPRSEAKNWNDKGYGIFWTINYFHGDRRIKENLLKINSYYADIDEGNKNLIIDKLKNSLMPSMIIESKRGFHAYWFVIDGTMANWYNISKRIIDYYDADKNAKDPLRLLRAPGFYHKKDPLDPFLISIVYLDADRIYTEEQLLYFYPYSEEERFSETKKGKEIITTTGNDLFEKIYNMNCEDGLERLSGMSFVNGERYTFKRTSGGKRNIYVNGKSTSTWIDADNRIGSSDEGGPTLWQWLRWYGHSDKEVYQIIKQVFPDVIR